MTQESRRKEIIRMLQDSVSFETSKLSEMFDVSPVTIRRDFEFLEKQGLVTTIYGGAMVNSTLPELDREESEKRLCVRERRAIAKAASEFIKPGMTVILDSGRTVKELAIELLSKENITVWTNSILAINILAQGSGKVSVISLPGTFKKSSMCFFGTTTVDFLDFVHADYAFMGTSALCIENGCSIPDPDEALVKKKMAGSAKKVIVLADHSKIGKTCTYTALNASDIDILITGNNPSEELEKFSAVKARIITVDY